MIAAPLFKGLADDGPEAFLLHGLPSQRRLFLVVGINAFEDIVQPAGLDDPAQLSLVQGKRGILRLLRQFSPGQADLDRMVPGIGLRQCIEICAGDYCETRFLDDTTNIVGYNIVLGSEAVGSFVLAYESGDMMEEPAYIYIYPMNLVAIEEGNPYIGKPYIYETTPKWCPTGDRQFWGGGNWFYVEGFNRNKERVYHKVRPISK